MIFLLRHGETSWNKEKRRQGKKDSKLTQRGIDQAYKIGYYLKKFNFSEYIIYSSPLGRTKQTSEIIASILNISNNKINYINNLKEMSFGEIEGKTEEEIKNNFSEVMKKREKDKWFFQDNGFESYDSIYKRAKSFLKSYELNNKSIIIITHETFIKAFLCAYYGYSKEQIFQINHPNNLIRVLHKDFIEEKYI